MTKINIGCGDHYAEGWTNTDITNPPGFKAPDVLCTATELPFESDSVDQLYAGHVLEHLTPEDVVKALKEFLRVLKPGASAMIVLPDLDVAEQSFPELVDSIRYGGDRWAGDKHLWESRPANFQKMLDRALEDTESVSRWVPILSVGQEWPVVSYIEWQYAYEITK